MASPTETINYVINLQEQDFVTGMNKANSSQEEFQSEAKQTKQATDGIESGFDGASLSAEGFKGAIAGLGLGALASQFGELNSQVLTTEFNLAKTQSTLGLTDAVMSDLTGTITEQGVQYGFTTGEMARLTALNATYIDTKQNETAVMNDLLKANELVIQTTILYAAKEGELAEASQIAVTAQEALRDVIITGSTTAFEDAGISLESYTTALIKNMGISQQQADVLAEGTNGTFEYAEAISKSATPQERFNALAEVTNQTLQDTINTLPENVQQTIEYKQAQTELTNAVNQAYKQFVLWIDDALIPILDWITQNIEVVSILAGTIIALITVVATASLVTSTYSIAVGIATGVTGAWRIATGLLTKAIGVLELELLPFIAIAFAVVGAIIAIIYVILNWGDVVDWITEKWNQFVGFMQGVGERLTAIWQAISDFFYRIFVQPIITSLEFLTELWNSFVAFMQQVGTLLTTIWQAVSQFFYTIFVQPIITGLQFLGDIWNVFAETIQKVGETLVLIWQIVVDTFKLIFVLPILLALDFLSQAWNNFVAFIQGVGERLSTIWQSIYDFFYAIFIQPMITSLQFLSEKWNQFVGFMQNIGARLNAIWQSIGQFFQTYFVDPLASGLQWVTDRFNTFVGFLQGVASRMRSIFQSIGDFFYSTFVEPILNGIQAVIDAFNNFLDFLNGILGSIESVLSSTFDALNPFRSLEQAVYVNPPSYGGGGGSTVINNGQNQTSTYNINTTQPINNRTIYQMKKTEGLYKK